MLGTFNPAFDGSRDILKAVFMSPKLLKRIITPKAGSLRVKDVNLSPFLCGNSRPKLI